MLQTGPICKTLTSETNESVIQKINNIVRSNLLAKTLISWIEDAVSTGNFYKFSRDTQNELLDTLYELSQTRSEFSENAGKLYVDVINALNPAN